ncbi:MAG: ABC transporter permease subunit, partial [Eubacteriales bacterium]
MKKEKIWYGIVITMFTMGMGYALLFTTKNPKYDLILSERKMLATAFFNTIGISLGTLVGALLIGFVLFMMMRSSMIPIRVFATVFNEIIMGTPLLVMIFVVVYVIGSVVTGSKLTLGIVALILYNSPYIANAYETTAAVVDRDQYVVMDLYDFKWHERYRYIIIPQMVKPFIPSLVNNLSSVIKGSALLNVIAVHEITYITTVTASRNFAFIEGYYIMWLMYLIVTIP